jgi:hypothetical protein
MYHKHTTFAFVLNVSPSGEKNHFITLFTRGFGMVRAKAQSVRVADSKLRYALQEFSYIEVSLVKGKEIWRITNALPIYNVYFELMSPPSVIPDLVRNPVRENQDSNSDARLDSGLRRNDNAGSDGGQGGMKSRQDIFMVIARIFSLLRRLMPEEGCESLIFNDMEVVCKNAQIMEYTPKSTQALEWLFILRMMCFLGYAHKENFADLCEDEIEWTDEYLESISGHKDNAIYSINNALKASHL